MDNLFLRVLEKKMYWSPRDTITCDRRNEPSKMGEKVRLPSSEDGEMSLR
jgi:hypothetical protein